MTGVRRTGAVASLVTVVLLTLAGPAAAHSELTSTSPSAGAVVAESPTEVVLRFNQSVEASLGAIRLYDREANRLDVGTVSKLGSDVVRAALPELDDGGYVVTFRVTSADAHPIQGAFTFRVGAALADAGDVALARRLLAESGGSPGTGLALAISRWIALVGLLVVVGGGVFVAVVDHSSAGDPQVRGLLWGALALAMIGTAGGLLAQAVFAAGLPLLDATDPDVLFAVADTRFGRVWLARLALLAMAALLLRGLGRRGDPARISLVGRGAAALIAIGLLATPALSGHAAAGPWAAGAIVLAVVHLIAVSTWIGGLVILLAARLRPGQGDQRAVVNRFSRVAVASVLVVLATGVAQGWREVRPLGSLTSTTYGVLLLAKFGAFCAIVAIASVSRRWVRGRLSGSDDVGILRRAVGAEVGVASAVLALTTLLVAAPPARVAYAKPFQQTLRTDTLWIDVSIEPAKAGRTDVHVYTYVPGGALTPVEAVTMVLRLPAQDIGPLEVPIERAGPAHFASYGFDLPLAGTWQLEVAAQLDSFREARVTTDVVVR